MSVQELYRITTDDTLRETVPHGSGRYMFSYYWEDVWQYDLHRADWHWHHELEFLSVDEGRLRCLVGEDTIELPAGSGLFVNSGVLHRHEAADGRTIIPNIVFSPAFLAPEGSLIYEKYVAPVICSSVPYCLFDPREGWHREVLGTLRQIYDQQETNESRELSTLRLTLRLWELLYANLKPAPEMPRTRRVDHRQAKLRLMLQYIHDHYSETISLEEIAYAALVSKSSALSLFQMGIHTSPVSYLIQYRLQCAGRLLCTTEKSVSVIAEETGFSSAGYFCRKFKEHYHMSPAAYRRERAGNSPKTGI